jgi:hypothetical protein
MKGWRGDNYRHSLAAKGIQVRRTSYSSRRLSMTYVPTYVAGDLAPIGVDAIGTTGAAAVGMIPLAVTAGVLYGGARYAKNKYERDKLKWAKMKAKKRKKKISIL